jgi:hypothetical protein
MAEPRCAWPRRSCGRSGTTVPMTPELMICSVRIDDVREDAEMIEDFWPE